MILTGDAIYKRLGNLIIIDPFDFNKLNPNSYNLTLNNKLLVYNEQKLDMKINNDYHIVEIPEEGLLLEPGRVYLGRTNEYTETQNLVPMLEGRSSHGRLGLFVHVTAGFGDIGFRGYWTLELSCVQPIVIYPNIDICQIYYHTIIGEVLTKYQGKYQDSQDVITSQIYQELFSK